MRPRPAIAVLALSFLTDQSTGSLKSYAFVEVPPILEGRSTPRRRAMPVFRDVESRCVIIAGASGDGLVPYPSSIRARTEFMHPFTQALLKAHRQATPLTDSEHVPQTIGEADAIQFEFSDALGGHGGWKMTPWSSAEAMLAAPIPQAWMGQSGAVIRPEPGSRLEVEFALLRGEGDWQVCLAFEFLRSRLAGQDWSSLARRADLLSAGGVVQGAAHPIGALAAEDGQLRLIHADNPAESVTTTFDPTSLLAAANWLESHAAELGRPLQPGMVVITGARIGPLPLADGTYSASWQGLDDVTMTISGYSG